MLISYCIYSKKSLRLYKACPIKLRKISEKQIDSKYKAEMRTAFAKDMSTQNFVRNAESTMHTSIKYLEYIDT